MHGSVKAAIADNKPSFTQAFLHMFENLPVAIIVTETYPRKNKIIKANKKFYEITGFHADKFTRHSLAIMKDVIMEADLKDFINRLHRQGRIENMEIRWRNTDGQLKIVITDCWNMDIANRKVSVIAFYDISDRKKAEKLLEQSYKELNAAQQQIAASEQELHNQYNVLKDKESALRRSEARFQLAVEASQNAICELDLKTGEYLVSPSWSKDTNLPYVANINEILKLMHPEDIIRREKALAEYLAGDTSYIVLDYRLKNNAGEWVWLLFRGRIIKDPDNTPARLLGAVSDISDLKKKEEQQRYRATHDQLTGLLNRRGFFKQVRNLLSQNTVTYGSLLLIDIDDFKLINDVHGHSTGDSVLQKFSLQLSKQFQHEAEICRSGGDEFLLFFPGKSEGEVKRRITGLGKQYIDSINGSFYLHFSSGVVNYPNQGDSLEVLLQKADLALNRAKKEGKQRCCVYDPIMHTEVNRRLLLREGLNKAIDNNELFLVYQPIYEINQINRITGFEALLRWNNPRLGFLSPSEFIPVAEETDTIINIGYWVIKEAVAFSARAKEINGSYIKISVNISVRQLMEPDFVKGIKEVLAEYSTPAYYLNLEITETMLMTTTATSIDKMLELKELGVNFSLDDFGTGYSSLTCLQKLPINVLKVDKAFINALSNPDDNRALAMMEIIISISQKLGYMVIAEGVETKEQLSLLISMGCKYCQGFLLNKPLSEQEVWQLMFAKAC